jgi:hypothetical protein
VSFWKSLGKGLLKAAPFAAMAIPGIGPLASAGIQAGLGAANAKASGGGLKDVLLGAGTGAAMSGVGGAAKGLSPSKGLLSNIGNFAKQTGKNALSQFGGSSLTGEHEPFMGPKQPSNWKSMLPGLLGAGGAATAAILSNRKKKQPEIQQGSQRSPIGPTQGIPRMNQTTPNLAFPIEYGRQQAMGQQPNLPPYMSYLDY